MCVRDLPEPGVLAQRVCLLSTTCLSSHRRTAPAESARPAHPGDRAARRLSSTTTVGHRARHYDACGCPRMAAEASGD